MGLTRVHTALGGYYCTGCGTKLNWNADFNRNEILGLDYDEMDDDDNSVVGSYTCPYCGEEYEIFSLSKNELEMLKAQEENG